MSGRDQRDSHPRPLGPAVDAREHRRRTLGRVDADLVVGGHYPLVTGLDAEGEGDGEPRTARAGGGFHAGMRLLARAPDRQGPEPRRARHREESGWRDGGGLRRRSSLDLRGGDRGAAESGDRGERENQAFGHVADHRWVRPAREAASVGPPGRRMATRGPAGAVDRRGRAPSGAHDVSRLPVGTFGDVEGDAVALGQRIDAERETGGAHGFLAVAVADDRPATLVRIERLDDSGELHPAPFVARRRLASPGS